MNTLYYNGTIITVHDAQPIAEALLVKNGKIAAVGTEAEVRTLADAETTMVDLSGKTMLPGFIDGHSHIGGINTSFPTLYCSPSGTTDSKEALLDGIRALLEKGELLDNGWLVVQGYDNAVFENQAHPTIQELDAISTEVPILALHASGHVAVMNTKGFARMGWTKDTPNPEGGVIEHDLDTGELTGFLEEKAIHLVAFEQVFKDLHPETIIKLFVNTQKYYASNGLTTAQEGATLPDMVPMLKYCRDNGLLLLDIVSYVMQDYAPELVPTNSVSQAYEHHLKFAGAKLVSDGSPQGKTAWLTEPYYEPPANKDKDYRGYPIYTDEQMYHFCYDCIKNNTQLLVHCNGDATADQFIRTYKQAKKELGSTADLRPVIIHGQTLREDQLDAMKELGMMVSFFHDHVFYWGDYHLDSVLGPERGRRISPLASALKRDIPFTLHSDFSVTPINVIFHIHNAVNRKTRNGRDCGPEFAVSVMDAIRAVTINGAYQYFDEDLKGSLEVGKLADLVILDKNPLAVPKETIKDIKVLETIKEGTTIYKA